MNVIPLTLIISLCLTITFIVFFWREQTRRRFSSSESESLLPLADETPSTGPMVIDIAAAAAARAARLAAAGAPPPRKSCANHGGHAHDHDHDHDHDDDGKEPCRGNGTCNSCERRKAHACASGSAN